jgi:hypothetical protein
VVLPRPYSTTRVLLNSDEEGGDGDEGGDDDGDSEEEGAKTGGLIHSLLHLTRLLVGAPCHGACLPYLLFFIVTPLSI